MNMGPVRLPLAEPDEAGKELIATYLRAAGLM